MGEFSGWLLPKFKGIYLGNEGSNVIGGAITWTL